MKISTYTSSPKFQTESLAPWEICAKAAEIIASWIKDLSDDYAINGDIAIHKTAIIETGAVLKGPCIIGENCFIASYAYLRGGVWLDKDVGIGPSTEIKSSFIGANTKAAHFNFVGDSIIGENVNLEAGAIIANYRNEWDKKEIICFDGKEYVRTAHTKFGAMVGDSSRIGANAVLAPGTILQRKSIVKRLELVDQIPEKMRI